MIPLPNDDSLCRLRPAVLIARSAPSLRGIHNLDMELQ